MTPATMQKKPRHRLSTIILSHRRQHSDDEAKKKKKKFTSPPPSFLRISAISETGCTKNVFRIYEE